MLKKTLTGCRGGFIFLVAGYGRRADTIGGCMPVGIRHVRYSGKSIIDVMVACVCLALLGCVVLPALSKERDDARIAECADHLKQLGEAAHQYAADFEGKFFYNRFLKIDHNKKYKPELAGRWFDPARVGQYLDGELMYLPRYASNVNTVVTELPDQPPPDWPHFGLGGGVFICPSDGEGVGRSYEMNYWAGTGYSLHVDEKIVWTMGELFDTDSPEQDKLMLFTDIIGLTKTSGGWVPNYRLGNQLLPGQRFGSDRPWFLDTSGRFQEHRTSYFTLLDYVRHGTNHDRSIPQGAVNITYADGHVRLRQHDQLFDSETKLSKYDTLWSPIDKKLEFESSQTSTD